MAKVFTWKEIEQGGTKQENPSVIELDVHQSQAEIRQYLTEKAERLLQNWTRLKGGTKETEARQCAFLEEALEASVEVAGRALCWLGIHLKHYSRYEIFRNFSQFGSEPLWRILRDTLIPIEQEYYENVRQRVKDRNVAAYLMMIADLKRIAMPMAYHFTKDCLAFLDQREFVGLQNKSAP